MNGADTRAQLATYRVDIPPLPSYALARIVVRVVQRTTQVGSVGLSLCGSSTSSVWAPPRLCRRTPWSASSYALCSAPRQYRTGCRCAGRPRRHDWLRRERRASAPRQSPGAAWRGSVPRSCSSSASALSAPGSAPILNGSVISGAGVLLVRWGASESLALVGRVNACWHKPSAGRHPGLGGKGRR